MSDKTPSLTSCLTQHDAERVELIVPDMAGMPRGKLLPANDLDGKKFKLPVALFCQTITGDYFEPEDNIEDRDMLLEPDLSTARVVPWASAKTVSIIANCFELDGSTVSAAPREVLKRVLALYSKQGWNPIVAPEVEFYLVSDDQKIAGDRTNAGIEDAVADPYGIDRVHELSAFFDELNQSCEVQGIRLGAVSQEVGPNQFEVNFDHGEPLRLADELFHFKRSLKHAAQRHDLRATLLAKPDSSVPGSAMHIHQSLCNANGDNVFSDSSGNASELFHHYIGGLQRHTADALLLFAPYSNSYRRFVSHWSSPMNLEWGVDNRTVGLRVPESTPQARRVENRLPGSDVNPYLAIAGTLACGYLGMMEKAPCREAVKGSAYDKPFALRRHVYDAIEALRGSEALAPVLGADFIAKFTGMKQAECQEFQERVPEWERDELAFVI